MQHLVQMATVTAPAKIILCGEHAVVYGYDAIALAINLRCKATVYKKGGEKQKIGIIQFKGSLECFVELGERAKREERQTGEDEVGKIYKKIRMMEQEGHEFSLNDSYVIVFESGIPIGKGLGSSASFNTILATCLLMISTTQRLQPLSTYLSKINSLSKRFEEIEHGTPSGIDNYVSVYGGLVLYNKKKNPPFSSVSQEKVLERLEELVFRLIDTGIEKNTKKAVGIVREKYNCQDSASETLKNIEEIGSFAGKIIEMLKGEGIEGSWKQQIFKMLNRNHVLLRQLGVSSKEIEKIVGEVNGRGGCAKITGAGMGGFVLVVEDAGKGEETGQGGIVTGMQKRGLIVQYS